MIEYLPLIVVGIVGLGLLCFFGGYKVGLEEVRKQAIHAGVGYYDVGGLHASSYRFKFRKQK